MEPWKKHFDVLYLYSSDKRLTQDSFDAMQTLCSEHPEL